MTTIRPAYIVNKTPAPRFTEATLTIPEWKAIKRARQLFNQGADLVIVQRNGNGLKVRPVGKAEG